MQVYAIPPRKHLDLSHYGDRYFCLAQQYIRHPEYKQFFDSLPKSSWITLDNGAGDHDSISPEELFQVTLQLLPNEVIPPDFLFEKDKTIKHGQEFIDRLNLEGLSSIDILFCPQGNNLAEWMECYEWALDNPAIQTIGLSKITVPKIFNNCSGDDNIAVGRMAGVNYLRKHNLLKKPIHLLGGAYIEEFQAYNRLEERSMFRSTDSCFTILAGYHYLDIMSDDYVRHDTPSHYFDLNLSFKQQSIAISNIESLKLAIH